MLDLFVNSDVRGKGYGRKLINATAEAAQNRPGGCLRVYWVTQHGNATARKLYDTLASTEFVMYRMPLPVTDQKKD